MCEWTCRHFRAAGKVSKLKVDMFSHHQTAIFTKFPSQVPKYGKRIYAQPFWSFLLSLLVVCIPCWSNFEYIPPWWRRCKDTKDVASWPRIPLELAFWMARHSQLERVWAKAHDLLPRGYITYIIDPCVALYKYFVVWQGKVDCAWSYEHQSQTSCMMLHDVQGCT